MMTRLKQATAPSPFVSKQSIRSTQAWVHELGVAAAACSDPMLQVATNRSHDVMDHDT